MTTPIRNPIAQILPQYFRPAAAQTSPPASPPAAPAPTPRGLNPIELAQQMMALKPQKPKVVLVPPPLPAAPVVAPRASVAPAVAPPPPQVDVEALDRAARREEELAISGGVRAANEAVRMGHVSTFYPATYDPGLPEDGVVFTWKDGVEEAAIVDGLRKELEAKGFRGVEITPLVRRIHDYGWDCSVDMRGLDISFTSAP